MLSAEKEIITKKAKTCHFQHDICLVSAQLISVLKFNSVRETVTNESLLGKASMKKKRFLSGIARNT